MKKSLTDEELVNIVRSKDQEQYRNLVKRYQDKLIRYATYLTNDDHAASDVVQEAFIRAFVNLKGFDINKSFSSWIYRIVHNQAINHIKQRRRFSSIDLQELLPFLSKEGEEEKKLEKKELKEMVKKSLSKLPIEYRSVLTLYYLENKPYKKISEILQIPIGTVSVRIHRAKDKMREIIIKKGGEYEKEKS